ncbi:hypothetical protein BOX15_Mlig019352g3 [Macrostomum lignano]|uniref:Large ribosomal subunit protein mL52 n=3 Tax=Macrostomum lignano TaxID=282301 RepID=A0A1I8INP5_9PLAT|nr:hypothetical protein BOX15_Mlig019352g3 [Macrostomum lignano]
MLNCMPGVASSASLLTAAFRVPSAGLRTSSCLANICWYRLRRGLPPNGNERGPLTDLPDWTFADGRPTPFSTSGQQRRHAANRQVAQQALAAMESVDLAAKADELRQRVQQAEAERLRPGLRPKGDAMLA